MMFTGLVEGTGCVGRLVRKGKGGTLSISIPLRWGRCPAGSSIAVDGCCLTLVRRSGKIFHFDISGETFKKTKIGKYHSGQRVNLERPLKMGDRLGGHLVLGHVDGIGKIRSIRKRGRNVEMKITAPPAVMRYVIPKGSVTVDGVSLTVTPSGRGAFRVFLIPATLKATNLPERRVGDAVNLEGDCLGKWVMASQSPDKSLRFSCQMKDAD